MTNDGVSTDRARTSGIICAMCFVIVVGICLASLFVGKW